jgi:protein tyrosine phosphatase
VYVAIDYTLDRLSKEDTINVLGVTSAMRTQRVLMIQNELQYIFVHKIIAKIINNKHFENLRENRFKFSKFSGM